MDRAEVEAYNTLDPGVRVLILKALCDIRVEVIIITLCFYFTYFSYKISSCLYIISGLHQGILCIALCVPVNLFMSHSETMLCYAYAYATLLCLSITLIMSN